MAEFPKLSDLPDDMTVGQLKRMSSMLGPSAPSTEGFVPSSTQSYANAREPSLRESVIDKVMPGPVSGASPLANSERDAYRAGEATADLLPFESMEALYGGLRGGNIPQVARGLGNLALGEGALDGNPLFYPEPMVENREPGFMEAQAGPKGDAIRLKAKIEADNKAKIESDNAASVRSREDAAAKAEAAEKKRLADAKFEQDMQYREDTTPFRQEHPWASMGLQLAPLALAGVLPYSVRKKANEGIEAGGARLSGLLDEFNGARKAGELEDATLASSAIGNEIGALEKATSKMSTAKGYGGAGLAGAAVSAEGHLAPDQIDAAFFPEGPEKELAKEKGYGMEALKSAGVRGLVGAGAGALGHYKAGPPKMPDALAKSKAATGYGTPAFDDKLEKLANTGRQGSMQGAANKITRETSDDMVRAESPIAGGKLKAAAAPAIPSKAAAKQIAGPTPKQKAVAVVSNDIAATKTKLAKAKKPDEIKALREKIESLEMKLDGFGSQVNDFLKRP